MMCFLVPTCSSPMMCRSPVHLAEAAERAVDLGDVLTGRSPGRTSDEQISVSDHCGLGIQDAAMAQLVMTGGPS